jgi:hypothetical protein
VDVDPRADDPFAALRAALATGPAWVRLDAPALARLEGEADAWPTVTDVRTAWVALGRGRRPPFGGPLADRTIAVLEELGLLDARGRSVRGRKVEPYASERLRAGLVRRYALRAFVHAYRHLDEAGFDAAVRSLLSDDAPATGASAAAPGDDADPEP